MENKPANAAEPNQTTERPKAVTRDVLNPPPAIRIDPKWRRHYRHLRELRDYFLRQKGMLAQEANEEQPTYSEHMADAGTDSYDRDFALGMLSSDQNALYEIDTAIRRIETGSYGTCELTGKPIPTERLDSIPWTRFTVEAEKQLEQRGAINHPRLGELGSLAEPDASEEDEPAEGQADENVS